MKIKDKINRGKKKSTIKLEEKIKQFLQNLEFNDVDGARDKFLINGVKIDVCGGWEENLLVIWCKDKEKLGKNNLESVIKEFRKKIPLLEKGFEVHQKYKKYTFLKYIIVTRDVRVKKTDHELAGQQPNIYLWDDDFLKYYSDLYDYIKPYAKYDLLGEMKIKPAQQHPVMIPAFQIKFDNVNVYNFVMNPKDLLEVSFVARREVGRERYYQRVIQKDRLLSIARYIEDGGKFPNNIIVSFRKDLDIKFHALEGPDYSSTKWPYKGISYGILEFPTDYRSCWIIDGQHRLYAFVNVKKSFYFNMPITAFEHLDIEQQCKFFLDINKNQKPVDPDLLWDLNGEMIPSEREGIISNIAKFLNSEDGSSLSQKIYYSSMGRKKKADVIKISAICIAIKKRTIVDEFILQNIKNPLFNKNSSACVKGVALSLSSYFDVLKNICPNNWRLKSGGFILTNVGISVMIGLFEKILSRTMQKKNRRSNDDDFRFYITPIKDILESTDTNYLNDLRLKCASEGGKSELLKEFMLKIRSETKDNLFGGENITTPFKEEFVKLEEKFKGLIKKKLYSSKNKNWFKDAVDSSTYNKALKNMKKHGIIDMDKTYLQVGLGECISIMRMNEKLFYPVFIIENESFSFSNKTILEGAFSLITIMRVILEAHFTGMKTKAGDEEVLRVYLDKMNKCLDGELEF